MQNKKKSRGFFDKLGDLLIYLFHDKNIYEYNKINEKYEQPKQSEQPKTKCVNNNYDDDDYINKVYKDTEYFYAFDECEDCEFMSNFYFFVQNEITCRDDIPMSIHKYSLYEKKLQKANRIKQLSPHSHIFHGCSRHRCHCCDDYH